MEQKVLLESWLRRKLNYHHYYRLREPLTVEYEFKTRMGHPGTYAFVRFACQPANEIAFQSTAVWPPDLSAEWIAALEEAVWEALVDGLVCSSHTPFMGCSLTLIEIKHDATSSDTLSFYNATRGAMAELRKDTLKHWQICPLDYLGGIGGRPLKQRVR